MRFFCYKIIIFFAACMLPIYGFSKTAADIMLAVDNRYYGDTRLQEGVLTLIDKNKNKRVRVVRQLMKDYIDNEKMMTQIVSPADVQGTTILSFDWDQPETDTETWLYLPQLKKVKRLATADQSSYFLGSDFTYADLSGLEYSDFDYQFAEDNDIDEQHWVVYSIPKASIKDKVIDKTGYTKIKNWVDKTTLLTVKSQFWLKEGNKIKYYSAKDIEKVDDIWVAKKMQMILTQGKTILHASVYQIDSIEFNVPVEDQALSTYAMERRID